MSLADDASEHSAAVHSATENPGQLAKQKSGLKIRFLSGKPLKELRSMAKGKPKFAPANYDQLQRAVVASEGGQHDLAPPPKIKDGISHKTSWLRLRGKTSMVTDILNRATKTEKVTPEPFLSDQEPGAHEFDNVPSRQAMRASAKRQKNARIDALSVPRKTGNNKQSDYASSDDDDDNNSYFERADRTNSYSAFFDMDAVPPSPATAPGLRIQTSFASHAPSTIAPQPSSANVIPRPSPTKSQASGFPDSATTKQPVIPSPRYARSHSFAIPEAEASGGVAAAAAAADVVPSYARQRSMSLTAASNVQSSLGEASTILPRQVDNALPGASLSPYDDQGDERSSDDEEDGLSPEPYTIDEAEAADTSDAALMGELQQSVLGLCKGFTVLQPDHVEKIQKNHELLSSQIASLHQQLSRFTKVRDAAKHLSLLNQTSKKVHREAVAQMVDAERRVDYIRLQLWKLTDHDATLQTRLHQHMLAVLAHGLSTHSSPEHLSRRHADNDSSDVRMAEMEERLEQMQLMKTQLSRSQQQLEDAHTKVDEKEEEIMDLQDRLRQAEIRADRLAQLPMLHSTSVDTKAAGDHPSSHTDESHASVRFHQLADVARESGDSSNQRRSTQDGWLLSGLLGEVDEYRQRNKSLEAKLAQERKESEAHIASLNDDIKSYKEEIRGFETQTKEAAVLHESRIITLSRNLDDALSRVAELEDQLRRMHDVEQARDQLQANLDLTMRERDVLQQQFQVERDQREGLEAHSRELQAVYRKACEEWQEDRRRLALASPDEVEKLRKLHESKTQLSKRLREQLTEANNKLEHVRKRNLALASTIENISDMIPDMVAAGDEATDASSLSMDDSGSHATNAVERTRSFESVRSVSSAILEGSLDALTRKVQQCVGENVRLQNELSHALELVQERSGAMRQSAPATPVTEDMPQSELLSDSPQDLLQKELDELKSLHDAAIREFTANVAHIRVRTQSRMQAHVEREKQLRDELEAMARELEMLMARVHTDDHGNHDRSTADEYGKLLETLQNQHQQEMRQLTKQLHKLQDEVLHLRAGGSTDGLDIAV